MHTPAGRSVEQSHRILLDEIGPAPDLTFVRPYGNIGAQLIWAGTRELLSGHLYREIGVDELTSASGELAVIGGGGAWSDPSDVARVEDRTFICSATEEEAGPIGALSVGELGEGGRFRRVGVAFASGAKRVM